MGVVFKAHDTMLNRTVALKFLPRYITATEEARARFLQEARAAATLNHPNVCTIHGIEKENDQQFIVMEYVDGVSLAQRIKRQPEGALLPIPSVLSYSLQIGEALYEAHRLGIVHRDIKSENIMINARDQIKVMDFGLAKLRGSAGLTKGPRIFGTLGYMAPEQIQGGEVDQRADIFSFGVVFYEMLIGHRPFEGDNDAAIVYAVLQDAPPPIDRFRSGVAPDFVALVLRALQKDPRDRFQSAMEVLDALRSISSPIVSPLPVQAGVGRPSKSARRKGKVGWQAGGHSAHAIALRVGIPAAVVAGSAAIVWFLTSAHSVHLTQTDSLVLAEFENRTEDTVFDHSLTQALRVKLRESTQFNVLPPDRVSSALELLRLPASGRLDDRTATAVALREGARAVVTGNVTRLGSTYVLTAGVIDASTGATVELVREEVTRIEDVLNAMDRLSVHVRERLGESIAQISKANAPLPEATTSSLKALELYARADILANDGKHGDAALLNQEAVDIDSDFVLAISELSYDYRKTGKDSLASHYHNKILPLIHRVTERERLNILATYYGPSFEFDNEKAREQVVKLTTLYPNDAYSFALLGHFSMFVGDTKGALEANARAIALNRAYEKNCDHNSGYALALDGRSSEALIFFHRTKDLWPGYPAVDMDIAAAHWINEDLDSSEAVLQNALGSSEGLARNQVRVVLSSLYHFEGKLTHARQLCLDGVRDCRVTGSTADEAYFQLLLGEIAGQENHMGELRMRLDHAAALSVSPYPDLPLIARTYARRGMANEAERILSRLLKARSFDPRFQRFRGSYIALVRGEILLSRREFRRARDQFESVSKIQASDPFYFQAREGIAECAAATADPGTPALFDSILSRRGETILGTLSSVRRSGFWTRWLWPDVELRLARFYAARNQNAMARIHMTRVMRVWKDADPLDRGASEARDLDRTLSGGE